MNIDIKIQPIEQICTGMTCFEASKYICEKINKCKPIKGIITIDDSIIPFSFSPYFMDGDIFTDNMAHRLLVKCLVPLYVYNNINP